MKDARTISKLNIKEAYWHVRLDHELSLITTMITPVGRFRWLRLPVGLKVMSEIFQRKLGEALEGLQNTINVTDDIVLAESGKTDEEAKTNLELRTKALKERCTQKGIILTNTKTSAKKEERFHGSYGHSKRHIARSYKSRCHTKSAYSNRRLRSLSTMWHCTVSLPMHPKPLASHGTLKGPDEKECCFQLEQ